MKTATRAVVIKNTGIDDLLSKFLVYFDASRNLTLATSTNISQWVDRISGLVASQATTSAQPLVSFRNGQTYVDIANANTRFLGVSIPTPLNINTSRAYFCFSNCVVVCTVNIPNSVTNFVIGRYGNLLSAIIIFNGVPTAEEDLRITEFLKRRLVYNFQGLLSFFRQDVTNGLIQRVVQISDVVFSGITNFQQAWVGCSSLTSFPLINTSSGTSFYEAWAFCSSLTSFPANFFNNWVGNPVANCFLNTWLNCTKLTAQSVENILVSINFSGKSAPAGATGTQADITISYATSIGTLSEATTTAITNLKSRGWKPSINGVYV